MGRSEQSRTKSILVLLCCAAAWGGCLQEPVNDRVWVAIEPIQCLGNSWERDWLERNDGDYAGYPQDLASQFRIIKAYFEEQGVSVHAMTSRTKYKRVCLACFCPRGDTLYIQVDAGDVEAMEREGFRREAPWMWGPITRFD